MLGRASCATMPDSRARRQASGGRRTRRRPDHRRRSGGRRVRLEPRRHAHEHPLPRAGRLDGSVAATRPPAWTGRCARSATSRLSPNSRRRPEDYPVNDAESPIAASMFNAVGGSTIALRRPLPAHAPVATSASEHSTASPTTGRSTTRRSSPSTRVNDEMMGVAGLAGDPAYPPKEVPLPPVPLGKLGETDRGRLRRARLALVAVGQRDRDARLRRSRRRA